MKKKTRPSPKSASWREIRQTSNRKVVTAHARRRILKGVLRAGLGVVVVIAAAAGVYFGFEYWQSGVQSVNTALPSQPLRGIVFSTDGVLTKSWVEEVLDLPEDVEIMAIDIHAKKLELERFGQVKSALIRRLPDQLAVEIRERVPVVRLATRTAEGGVVTFLVDREGYVYEGIGYGRFVLSELPFLGGVRLEREGESFRRLKHLDRVAELLGTAREEMPHLYDGWRVIDCADMPLIKVTSENFKEVIFGPDRYSEQLRMLDMIVASNRRQMLGMQEQVDLSLGGQVVVR